MAMPTVMIKLRIISGKLTDWLLLVKPALFSGTIPVVRGAGGRAPFLMSFILRRWEVRNILSGLLAVGHGEARGIAAGHTQDVLTQDWLLDLTSDEVSGFGLLMLFHELPSG
jgi:hypothetical protein